MSKQRANPLPVPTQSGLGFVGNDEEYIARMYYKSPERLWAFLIVVLERIAIYYTEASIVAHDQLESILDAAEQWAVTGDELSREYVLDMTEFETEVMRDIWDHRKNRKNELDMETEYNLSHWATVFFLSKSDLINHIDSSMRNITSNIARDQGKPNSVLSLRPRSYSWKGAQEFVAFMAHSFLSDDDFPRDMFIGLDPEDTNKLAYELFYRERFSEMKK